MKRFFTYKMVENIGRDTREMEESMDIYPFIDSQAIREHLQKMDYYFNAEEAAFLIWHSQKRTLEEDSGAGRLNAGNRFWSLGGYGKMKTV